MPFGEFQYSVDDKGRVIIPPSFRNFVKNGMVATRGMEGCLYVFPVTQWEKITDRLNDLPITDRDSQNFVRFFYSGAAELSMDSGNRVSIPSTLRLFAGAENNVVVAGAPNRLEVWNESRWLTNLATIQSNPPSPELLRELVG